MSLFVFGLGYSALHFVRTRRIDAAGTVTSAEKATALRTDEIDAHVFLDDIADAAIDERLAVADQMLVSVPPSTHGCPVLARFAETIADAPGLARIVYLSTIGVYGDHGGAWIDEDTPPRPVNDRSRDRLVTEDAWRAFAAQAGKALHILRLAGIYGPGQNALVNVANGTARRIVKPGQVFNRIHVADIARAIGVALCIRCRKRYLERQRRRAGVGAGRRRLCSIAPRRRAAAGNLLRLGRPLADGTKFSRRDEARLEQGDEVVARCRPRLPDLS